MNLPSEYLILEQPPGSKATVTHHKADSKTVLFEGGRCAAKRFLDVKAVEIGWENIPHFNLKKGRAGTIVQCHPKQECA
jgi:hypothetical protein